MPAKPPSSLGTPDPRPARGKGHLYCLHCGIAVRKGQEGCGRCKAPLARLIPLDDAFDGGFASPGRTRFADS